MSKSMETEDGGRRLNRLFCIAILTFLAVVTSASASLVHANSPSVTSVVAFGIDGSTYLNVTVNHANQDPTHYVNEINVSLDGESGPRQYLFEYLPTAPNGDAVYQCNLGPISQGYAVVMPSCSIHGQTIGGWWGAIPEFSLPTSLLALALATTVAAFSFRKTRPAVRQ